MFQSFDIWIGKKVFHPIIIRLCWLTGLTQYALSNYVWIIAICGLLGSAYSLFEGSPWVGSVLLVVDSIFLINRIYMAIALGDIPVQSRFSGRMVIWGLLLAVTGPSLFHYWILGNTKPDPFVSYMSIYCVFGLLAEYARTIDTLPPKPRKESHRVARTAMGR